MSQITVDILMAMKLHRERRMLRVGMLIRVRQINPIGMVTCFGILEDNTITPGTPVKIDWPPDGQNYPSISATDDANDFDGWALKHGGRGTVIPFLVNFD